MTVHKIDLSEMTIDRYHQALTAGTITCRKLVDYYLDRIERFDRQGPALNAVIYTNPAAREIADAFDERVRNGEVLGALFGVPVLLKDNIDTYDMPTTAGSKSLEGIVPPDDAFIVKKLRGAGAIILAKVNLSEFACTGETLGSLIGQTKNPYDLGYTPGGSSGGTGAGLAADFGLVGIGSDTVNSVRSPASACCLVGLRPTRGLVSRDGVIPYSYTQDTAGPLARTVKDAARVLEAIAGYDPSDPVTAWSYDCDTLYAEGLETGLQRYRVGVVQSMLGRDSIHAEVTRAVEQAVEMLRSAGADVVDFGLPIDTGKLLNEFNVQSHEQDEELTKYLESLKGRAPYANFAELLASGKIDPWVSKKMQLGIDCGKDVAEYHQRLLMIASFRQELVNQMALQGVDALVYPMQKQLVARIGESQKDRNGILASVTGFPAITIPGGFSKPTDTAPIGIPIGVEFLGRPFSERLLLQMAYAYEQASSHRKPPVL